MLMENIMNGNYWFIPLSLLMTVLSCMSYFYFAYKDYEDDSEQIRYVTMSARLIIGCLALVVVSLLYMEERPKVNSLIFKLIRRS